MPELPLDEKLLSEAQELADNKNYDAALATYEKLLAFKPDDETIKLEYVDVLREYGEELSYDHEHEHAKNILEKALTLSLEDSDLYTDLGREYHHLNENEKAIEFYEKAIHANGNDEVALLELANIYSQTRQVDKAIEYYSKAADADKTDPRPLNGIGEILLSTNEPDKAIEQFRLALERDPRNRFSFHGLGRAYNAKGEVDEAANYFREAIQSDKTFIDPHIYLGNILLDKNEFDQAIDLYKTTLNYLPGYKIALFNLAVAYGRKKETALAIDYYRQSMKSDPGYLPAYAGLGNLYITNGDFDNAIQTFVQALLLEPNNKTTLSSLASAYRKAGNLDKAVEYYRLSIAADPSHLDYYIDLGNILLEKEDHQEAIKAYETALQYDAGYKYSLFNLALTYSRISENDKAISYYQKVIAADPTYTEAFNALGNIYEARNEYNKALENYEQALAVNPDFKYAHFNKAVVYTKTAEIPKAIACYQQAIKIDPNYADAFTALGVLYQNAYQYDNALAEYSSAVEIISKTDDKVKLAEAYYNLGNLFLDKLHYEEARKNYDKALEVHPEYVFPQHNKAWIYEKLGQYKTSKIEWAKAKELYANSIKKPSEQTSIALATKYFYYAEILNHYIDDTDPEHSIDKIGGYYQDAIREDHASVFFRLSYMKFCLKEKAVLENKKQKKTDDDLQAEINEFHIQALHQFRTGIDLLQKKLEKQKDKFDFADLGEFYLSFEQYKEAASAYEEAVKLDNNFTRGLIGLGVAQSKMDNYLEAIKYFKKALMLDPDDLNVQSNLADAYLKSEKLSLAEEGYKKILRTASCHIEAMLGLAEHYKMVADKMAENEKLNDSEEYLKQSLELYEAILLKNEEFSSTSRKLTNDELSAVNYSVGYIKVKLYEIHEGLGFRPLKRFDRKSHLKSALKSFSKIREGQPDYYKAQTAIKKIDKQFALDAQAGRKSAPLLIFLLSLFICLTMQFFFWLGRPDRKDVWAVNKDALQTFIVTNKLDSVRNALNELVTTDYNSVKDFQERLKTTPLPQDLLHKLETKVLEQKSKIDFEPIDPAPYALITFGALIFMVVGLFLRDISKLKVGSIELEKTTSDTISTSPTLGIGR